MGKGKRGKEVTESYTPDAEFKEFLDAILQHETTYQQKMRKIRVGEKGVQPPTDHEEQERENLRTRKTRWLNKCVFPSMANLTVFLEYIAKSDELQKVFDDDLQELFLGRNTDKGKDNATVFQRFIESAIKWNLNEKRGETEKETKKRINNFRLALIHIIEDRLFQHLNNIGANLLGRTANYTVSQDSSRVLAWAETLARNVEVEDVADADRPVRF